MSKRRRTADDFVRDMKGKQQRSTIGDSSAKPARQTPERTSPQRKRKNMSLRYML
jgi:hypothetical protein